MDAIALVSGVDPVQRPVEGLLKARGVGVVDPAPHFLKPARLHALAVAGELGGVLRLARGGHGEKVARNHLVGNARPSRRPRGIAIGAMSNMNRLPSPSMGEGSGMGVFAPTLRQKMGVAPPAILRKGGALTLIPTLPPSRGKGALSASGHAILPAAPAYRFPPRFGRSA